MSKNKKSNRYWTWKMLVIAMPLVPLAFGLAFFVGLIVSATINGGETWLAQIENPNERGLAYVAVAIVFHAMLSGKD